MIETGIRNAMLADATINSIVGTSVYFPIAPSDAVQPCIVFYRLNGTSNFYETENDDLYQIDIFVDRNRYDQAMDLKNAIKKLFLTAHTPECVMNYESDTQELQTDDALYRVIMTYKVNSKI